MESLIGEIAPAQNFTIYKNKKYPVPWMGLLLGTFIYLLIGNTHRKVPNGTVIPIRRRLLLFADDHGYSPLSHGSGSEIGSFLGWTMAVIYMGGRLPQIFLNIQRGHVEGLNPLMFTFAFVANLSYVGSILVNSLDWANLRPNPPWLVDAGGCVLLDAFIILQFFYFHYQKQSEPADEHDNADKS